MSKMRIVTLLACAGLFLSPAMAQVAAPSAVLSEIPAGTMGFVVANSVKGATDNVDKFLADIGVGELLKDEMPKGLLEKMKSEIALGEGFDSTGGFAMVLLEGAPFGLDYAALIEKKMNNEDTGEVKLPWVMVVPGTSLEAVFPSLKDAKKEKVGDATKVEFPFGELLTVQHGKYLLLSPVEKALTAVTSAKKTAKDELGKNQRDVISRGDVAIHVNLKVSGSVINKILGGLEKKMKDQAGHGMMPFPMDFGKMMQVNKDQIAQIDAVTIAAHVAKTGLVIEEMVDLAPDSAMAKELKGLKPSGKSLVGRLPNFSYVLAGGGSGNPAKDGGSEMVKTSAKNVADMLVKLSGDKITKAQGDKLQKLVVDLNAQCVGGQFVVGQAPADNGLIAAALLMEAKDAAKVKASLAEAVDLLNELVQTAAPEEDIKQVKFTYYTKGSDGVDVIEVTHPDLAKLGEEEQAMMKKFIGEDKIRITVASPDKTTVLVTFGGGKAFQEAALKAAKDGGDLPKDKGLTAAMTMMPQNPIFLMAFNVGNLFDTISKGVDITGMGAMMPPIKLTSQVPLTVGVGVMDNSEHVVIYVPTEMVKEVASIFTMFMGRAKMGVPGGPPVVAPGDF